MKIIVAILAGILCLSLGNIYAGGKTKLEHYIFRYDTGDTYDVKLSENAITWTGLEGSDTGQSETDLIKRKKLSNDVEVIQWNENSKTFVTLVFDRAHLRTVSSGKTPNGNWLAYGVAEDIF
ncbi:MAG: hypothetical protein ACD_46C00113G0006 [uncultured bacterium]|nr:MAG: hypothetical protein ACD_46C00113G0006 [uncultured bacterium]